MDRRSLPLTIQYLLPAVAMSLGWGLRGFIGGGPLGAMIPGAMIALVMCLLLDRDDAETGLIAAFGAIGVGLGGQETYGQTVGLSTQSDTFWWAILGFFIKGAVWGLSGGAILGWALSGDARRESRFKSVLLAAGGLVLMLAATHIGWKWIDEPKLMYFSNRYDRPRMEIWAGLLIGGIALVAYLNRKRVTAVLPFALWGTLGGGVGFALGAWFNALGRWYGGDLKLDWWKLMEFTFGFLLGLGFAIAAARSRSLLAVRNQTFDGTTKPSTAGRMLYAVACAAALVLIGIGLEYNLNTRMTFSIAGSILILAAVASEIAAWQVAMSVTVFAFVLDYFEGKKMESDPVAWISVIAVTAVVAILTIKRPSALPMFRVLMWLAVAIALAKALAPWPHGRYGTIITQSVFVAMAIACTIWSGRALRLRSAGANAPR